MGKVYLQNNVLEAAFDRLEIIFNNFTNIYFSFSGGKDSSVMIQLANVVAKKLNKTFDVLYIDFEAQYQRTINHVNELKTLSQIRDFYHVALPMALRNAVSNLQPKWICWEEKSKDLWVRELPEDSINIHNNIFDFFKPGAEFEDFIMDFAEWYSKKYSGKCACGVGIRADESFNRFRTVAMPLNKLKYKNYNWTTKLKRQCKVLNVYNFYPIYDWRVEDIWCAVSKLDLKFNLIYELMYKNGLSIYEQRLCQPYGDDQRNGLNQFKTIEYETWIKVLNRVNGVNFGNIYCKTTALGNIKSCKPNFMSWQQYAVFLLESIGIYNRELMLHYYEKIKKFMKWYKNNHNINLQDIEDKSDKKLEAKKKVISWRRIARALEKNDFYMKRLSFGQTKMDYQKLVYYTHRWNNIINKSTETTDKDLKAFIDKEVS